MDNIDQKTLRGFYLAIRIAALFVIGWMVGLKEPEKLLIAFVCMSAFIYAMLGEATLDKNDALAKLRGELVREQYGKPR